MFLFCCSMCFAEHPEDKQLPVHPAAGHPSSVCYHPQFTPPRPGILRHAHHLQPCWWVWPRSLPFKAKNSLLAHVTVWTTRRCFLLSVFSVISISELKCELSQCVAMFCFGRVLPEQRGDLFPTGFQLSWALTGFHVGMATASAWPGSS